MNNGFLKTTLGDLTVNGRGEYGIGAPAVEYAPNLYRYLRITDISDSGTIMVCNLPGVDDEKANQYLLRPNDIVFARTGASTGRSYFYTGDEGPVVFAGFLIRFHLDESKVNPKYLRYYTLSNNYKRWISSFNAGSTRGNINAKTYAGMEVHLPSRSVQDLLVETLSCLDGKIELNNKICANLEAQAQAIFKSWFASPEAEAWDYGTLSDIAEINPKRPLSKSTMATFVEMSNLPTSGSFPLDWTKRKYVAGGMKFQNGDTLLARITPCLENGKTAYVNFLTDQEVAFGSTEYIVMCAKVGYPNELLYFLARDTEFVSFAVQNMSGSSGRQRVAGEVIANYQMLIPPKAFVDTYSQLFVSIMNTIRSHSFESRTLAALRDALLPRLMNGEIEVPMEVDYGCY